MGQTFPEPQMPLDQKCLLLYLFNKIIESDLITDSSGYKELWAEKWRMQVNTFLRKKRKNIEFFYVLKNPDDAFTDIIDNLDSQALYDEIASQRPNLIKSWGLVLYGQCKVFYLMIGSIYFSKKNVEKKGGMKSYIRNSKPYAQN